MLNVGLNIMGVYPVVQMNVHKIDRAARDKAAVLLSQFLRGEITNAKFDSDWPKSLIDPALDGIYERIWCFYDDNKTYTLVRSHLDQEVVNILERCICFLGSDLEYEWPHYSFTRELPKWLAVLLWQKRRQEKKWNKFVSSGEFSIWPFLRNAEHKNCR